MNFLNHFDKPLTTIYDQNLIEWIFQMNKNVISDAKIRKMMSRIKTLESQAEIQRIFTSYLIALLVKEYAIDVHAAGNMFSKLYDLTANETEWEYLYDLESDVLDDIGAKRKFVPILHLITTSEENYKPVKAGRKKPKLKVINGDSE